MSINLNLGAFGHFCVDALDTLPDGSVVAVNPRAGLCPVVQPPQTEPPGRQRAASIKYPNAPGSRIRTADLAFWDSLFGHRNDTDPVTPWPGAFGTAPAVIQFSGSGYVALEFTPTRHAQVMVNVSSYNGVLMEGAWSQRPGDFSTAEVRGPGESFQKLSSDPSKPGLYIPVGQRAYLNLRLHTPQTTSKTVQFGLSGILYP